MRLLLIGQAAQRSGYARVLRSLAPHLAGDRCTVSYFTVNTRRADAVSGSVDLVPPRRLSDPFGYAELPEVLRRCAPDVVLACHDAAVLANYARLVRAHRPLARVALYVALEFDELRPAAVDGLNLADDLVCYTRAAAGWLAAHVTRTTVSVLPHGVDTTVFRDVDRAAARRLLRLPLPEGAPLILNANRDTPRKCLDTTVLAFAQAARTAPDARLLLLHGERHRALAREAGIEDKLIVPPEGDPFDDATLNLYYNSADIGINTCTSEGWGLTAFEHAASGGAQVMPDLPALRENWADHALLVPGPATPVAGYRPTAPAAHAQALTSLLTTPSLRTALAHRATELAHAPHLAWPRIASRWRRLLDLD